MLSLLDGLERAREENRLDLSHVEKTKKEEDDEKIVSMLRREETRLKDGSRSPAWGLGPIRADQI